MTRIVVVIASLCIPLLMIGCGEGTQENVVQGNEVEQVEEELQDASNVDAPAAETEHAHFRCPMDCEEGKVYHDAGTCPECGMDLEQLTEH